VAVGDKEIEFVGTGVAVGDGLLEEDWVGVGVGVTMVFSRAFLRLSNTEGFSAGVADGVDSEELGGVGVPLPL